MWVFWFVEAAFFGYVIMFVPLHSTVTWLLMIFLCAACLKGGLMSLNGEWDEIFTPREKL